MVDQEFLYTKSNGVATLQLNRPSKLNAFNDAMLDAWIAALEDAAKDDDVRAVLLTGTGRAFCVGGDTGGIARRTGTSAVQHKDYLWRNVHRIPLFLESFDKPYICAINGLAVAAGLDMALMADYRIAASSARFRQGYLALAMMPGDGGAYYLPRVVGMSKALEMLWTTRWVDSDEALSIGLVDRVVPDEELASAGLALAQQLADGPQLAIRMVKRATRQSMRMDLPASLDLISSHMAVVKLADEHKEALAAKNENRPPDFRNPRN